MEIMTIWRRKDIIIRYQGRWPLLKLFIMVFYTAYAEFDILNDIYLLVELKEHRDFLVKLNEHISVGKELKVFTILYSVNMVLFLVTLTPRAVAPFVTFFLPWCTWGRDMRYIPKPENAERSKTYIVSEET